MPQYQINQHIFDASKGELSLDGSVTAVRHKVSELIGYLISHRDRVVSKEELLKELWDHGEYRENSLTQSIREARKLLGDSAQEPTFIRTYPQKGYQWVAETSDLDENLNQPESPEQIPSEMPEKSTRHHWLYPTIGLLLIISLSSIFIWQNQNSDTTDPIEQVAVSDRPSLLILPFINRTERRELSWLESGLSDLVARSLMVQPELRVTPPEASHNLLALSNFSWPISGSNLPDALETVQADIAILGEIREYKDQQVLEIQIHYRTGEVRQGTISAKDLAAASPLIHQQLIRLMQLKGLPSPYAATTSEANKDYLRGLQALQQQGPNLAYHLFSSALLQDESHQEALAYSGYALLKLGQWQQAEKTFDQISLLPNSLLNSQIQLWRAEINFRRGNTQQAAERLNDLVSNQPYRHDTAIAGAYRLLARIAQQSLNWQDYRKWTSLAESFSVSKDDLSVQAERLFYLGNPVQSGLEKDRYNDLMLNGQRLKKALNYYQTLNNLPQVAAAQFAIAQNYYLPLAERKQAMDRAEQLWRKLKLPYELAQLLTYRGFFALQLHKGEEAIAPLDEALAISEELGARWLLNEAKMYRAFAELDQGIDRGNGGDRQALQRAIELYDELIDQDDISKKLKADSLTLQGWAYSELSKFTQAQANQQQALKLYSELGLATSRSYTVYSMMWNHLQQNEPEQVLGLAGEPVESRLQLDYLARAYHSTGDVTAAIATQNRIRNRFPDSWTAADDTLLQQLRSSPTKPMPAPQSAHLVYCESDWYLEPTTPAENNQLN